MKKKTIILSAIVLCLVCVIGCISVLTPKDYLAIQNDDVYFGMSSLRLKWAKDVDYYERTNHSDTPLISYTFDEKIHGNTAKSTYFFRKTVFGEKLIRADITFENINYDIAKNIIEKMSDLFSKEYSVRTGFYDNALIEQNNLLEKSLGVDTGATGISCTFEYSKSELYIYLVKQE